MPTAIIMTQIPANLIATYSEHLQIIFAGILLCGCKINKDIKSCKYFTQS